MSGTTLKNKIINLYIIFLLITGGFIGVFIIKNVEEKACVKGITVNDDGGADYIKIQDAINNATTGDTIHVWAGTYNERVEINKTITIIGNGSKNTIINGTGVGDVIKITANWVNISGFTITGSGKNYYSPEEDSDAGIEILKAENVTIKNNNCSFNNHGIFLKKSNSILIFNNTFIFNNWSGIKLVFSNSNEILDCLCFDNPIGIMLYWNCDNNTIINNNCSKNYNGIFLEESEFNIIANNTLKGNEFGFKFYTAHNNTINKNNILNNNLSGFHIQYGSKDNYIFHNNFINNQNNYADTTMWWGPGVNYYNNSNQEGNYWSNYTGNDTGNMTYSWDITGKHLIAGDGIGDTELPYYGYDYYPYTNRFGWILPATPKLIDPGNFNSDGAYQIIWNKSFRARNYVIEEDINQTFNSPVEIYHGSNNSVNLTNKDNGTYYYRVKAKNIYGSSNWSNIENITVDWPPNIPKNLSALTHPPGNSLNLSWLLNIVDTEEYILQFKNETMINWEQLEPISHPFFTFNHTELIDGVSYSYRIQARDYRNQLSNFSEIIYGIPWDSIPPAPPMGLTIVSTTYNSISLTWNPNTEDDFEGYHVYRSEIPNPNDWGKPIETTMKGTEEYLDIDLDENTTYYYVLTAFDEVPNNSSYSNIALGTTILGPHGPMINNPMDDFSIPEDNIDDSTIKLYDWFFDINNDPLEFKYEGQIHLNVSINQQNGYVTLIPEKNWNGQETLTFYANDSNYEICDDVTITVTPVNDPPGPSMIIIPKDGFEVENGTAINFSGICDDVDLIYGDKLTFNWSSNITGKLGSGENLTEIILQPGYHQIKLEVSDIVGETAEDIVNIAVLHKLNPDNNVTPIFDLKLDIVPTTLELKPDGQGSVKAIVTNLGSHQDEISLSYTLQNGTEIEIVIIGDNKKIIEPNKTVEFIINLKISDDIKKGEIIITFTASSNKASDYELEVKKNAILTIKILEEKDTSREDKSTNLLWIIILLFIIIIVIMLSIIFLSKKKKEPPEGEEEE